MGVETPIPPYMINVAAPKRGFLCGDLVTKNLPAPLCLKREPEI